MRVLLRGLFFVVLVLIVGRLSAQLITEVRDGAWASAAIGVGVLTFIAWGLYPFRPARMDFRSLTPGGDRSRD